MKILNRKGSALLWAVCAITVLTLVVAGILTFGMSYYKRALREATREQALLYARCTIEYVQNQIINEANPDFIPDSPAIPITLTFNFDTGECVVVIEKTFLFEITISASSRSGASYETLGAIIEIDEYDTMSFLGYTNE